MDSSDYLVKYRKDRNLSQQQFAKSFNVPLSTLRKWEQKESKPSRFFIEMIKQKEQDNKLITFKNDKTTYIFDPEKKIVYNNQGTGINVQYDLTKVNKNNLFIILDQLFFDYNKMIGKFTVQCKIDQERKDTWRQLK